MDFGFITMLPTKHVRSFFFTEQGSLFLYLFVC